MKRILVGLFFWFALCSSGTSIDAADQSKILALENAWNQAQLHHDAVALDQLLPATFVNTDYDGTVTNKGQFLADLKDPAYQASLVANQDVRIYSYSNAAVVTGIYHTKGKYKGKPFEHWGRFTDTWLVQNGVWQCVASHSSLIKKPADPQATGRGNQ
jgi:ketosteroid isomerase-like protein